MAENRRKKCQERKSAITIKDEKVKNLKNYNTVCIKRFVNEFQKTRLQ